MEWQPIETAPKDHGDRFLAYDPDVGFYVCDRFGEGFVSAWDHDKVSPTHWMPLPEPPKP